MSRRPSRTSFIIVGGGPCGLAIAHYLNASFPTAQCTIVERMPMLGGCHRVQWAPKREPQRVSLPFQGHSSRQNTNRPSHQNNKHDKTLFFTEHGPRIYLNSYTAFKRILADLDQTWDDWFVAKSQSALMPFVLKSLSWRELFSFVLFYTTEGTVSEFMSTHNFSEKSRAVMDTVCRVTDGAGADRYTMRELWSIAWHAGTVYYARRPLQPLWDLWGAHLSRNNSRIHLNTEAVQLTADGVWVRPVPFESRQPRETSSALNSGATTLNESFNFVHLRGIVVLALPPMAAATLLPQLKPFALASNYVTYISITFHYESRLNLVSAVGLTDWGIVMLEYNFDDSDSFTNSDNSTVLSVAVTRSWQASAHTNKSAQDSTRAELIAETFRQLQTLTGPLPQYVAALLSPSVHCLSNEESSCAGWRMEDSAFVLTTAGYCQSKWSLDVSDLSDNTVETTVYSVGNHNGNTTMHFTSIEGAIVNARAFVDSI